VEGDEVKDDSISDGLGSHHGLESSPVQSDGSSANFIDEEEFGEAGAPLCTLYQRTEEVMATLENKEFFNPVTVNKDRGLFGHNRPRPSLIRS
jgi:hypothetical protein